MATVVSCYYKIKSKHTHEEYDKWITHFLSKVSCNLVVFTSPDLVEYIKLKRVNFLTKTVIIPIAFEDLYLYRAYEKFWDAQYKMDIYLHESQGRTKECYVLWNSKLHFLKVAIEKNPFLSDKFIWADIGCLRSSLNDSDILDYYPVYNKISSNKIDIVLKNPIHNLNQKIFLNEVHFAGSMFGGHKDVIGKFYDLFYQRFHQHIQSGIFIGCDQQTISSVYNENRDLFNCITPTSNLSEEWKWFFMWIYYSV